MAFGTDELDTAQKLYAHIWDNFTCEELRVLMMCRAQNADGSPELDENGNCVLRYLTFDGTKGRPITFGDCEHMSCMIYQFLAWTMPNRQNNLAQPAQPHHHPTRMEWLSNQNGILACAESSLSEYLKMVEEGTWKEVSNEFHLANEDPVRDCLDNFSFKVQSCDATQTTSDVSEKGINADETNQTDMEQAETEAVEQGGGEKNPDKVEISLCAPRRKKQKLGAV